MQLEIKDDEVPEPDEQLLAYLTDATGGARVATDSNSGLQVTNFCVSFPLSFTPAERRPKPPSIFHHLIAGYLFYKELSHNVNLPFALPLSLVVGCYYHSRKRFDER